MRSRRIPTVIHASCPLEIVHRALMLALVIVQGRIARLNVRPHRAVIDNDALFHGL
jgi:hypothetical protein